MPKINNQGNFMRYKEAKKDVKMLLSKTKYVVHDNLNDRLIQNVRIKFIK